MVLCLVTLTDLYTRRAGLSCNYLYFRNRATNFVEICKIYTNHMTVKGTINFDKLSRNYDDLYLGVTFLGYTA